MLRALHSARSCRAAAPAAAGRAAPGHLPTVAPAYNLVAAEVQGGAGGEGRQRGHRIQGTAVQAELLEVRQAAQPLPARGACKVLEAL